MSRRKRFRFADCNHLGKGAYCHRCKDGNALMRRAWELRQLEPDSAAADAMEREGKRLRGPYEPLGLGASLS